MAAVSPAGPDPMISSFVRLASRSAPSSGPPGRLDRGRGTVAGGASKAIGGPKEIGPVSLLPFAVSPPPKSIVRPANGSFFFSVSSLIASHRSTERIPPGGIGRGRRRVRETSRRVRLGRLSPMPKLYALHQALFSFGGDAWIEDDAGNRAFEVDGKTFALGRTLDLLD